MKCYGFLVCLLVTGSLLYDRSIGEALLSCPENSSQYNSSCYLVTKQNLTWDQAVNSCIGKLAIVKNAIDGRNLGSIVENSFSSVPSLPVWIGGREVAGQLLWSPTGAPISWTNFANPASSSSVSPDSNSCLTLRPPKYVEWKLEPCDRQFFSLCFVSMKEINESATSDQPKIITARQLQPITIHDTGKMAVDQLNNRNTDMEDEFMRSERVNDTSSRTTSPLGGVAANAMSQGGAAPQVIDGDSPFEEIAEIFNETNFRHGIDLELQTCNKSLGNSEDVYYERCTNEVKNKGNLTWHCRPASKHFLTSTTDNCSSFRELENILSMLTVGAGNTNSLVNNLSFAIQSYPSRKNAIRGSDAVNILTILDQLCRRQKNNPSGSTADDSSQFRRTVANIRDMLLANYTVASYEDFSDKPKQLFKDQLNILSDGECLLDSDAATLGYDLGTTGTTDDGNNTSEWSSTDQSSTVQSATDQSSTDQSSTDQSSTDQSSTDQSSTDQSSTQQSSTDQSSTEQRTTEQATTEQTTTKQTTTVTTTITTTKPTTTTEPTTTESSTSPTQYCPETVSRDVTWPSTPYGHQRTMPCPDGAAGSATWVCDGTTGSFLAAGPDLSNCTELSLDKITDELQAGNMSANEILMELSEELEVAKNVTLHGGDIKNIVNILTDLYNLVNLQLDDGDSPLTLTQTINFTRNFLPVCDFVLDRNKLDSWNDLHSGYRAKLGSQLMATIDQTGFLVVDHTPFNRSIFDTRSTEMDIRRHVGYGHDTHFPYNTTGSNSSIVLPDNVSSAVSMNGTIPVVFVKYRTIGDILPNGFDLSSNYTINSEVIGASLLPGETSVYVDGDVQITFTHRTKLNDSSNSTCVFWNYTIMSWDVLGCVKRSDSNEDFTTCICNHMTNFAVMINVYGTTNLNMAVLNWISVIGCSISIVCLAFCIVSLSLVRNQRGNSNVLHLNLCISLLVGDVIMIASIFYNPGGMSYENVPCEITAVALHYFFLASFMWMGLEGLNIYMSLIKIFKTRTFKLYAYLLAGYGIPVFIVGIAILISYFTDYTSTSNSQSCWLEESRTFMFCFSAFVLVVILFNSTILILALRSISAHSSQIKKFNQQDKLETRQTKKIVWQIIILHPLLGLAWILGFLQFGPCSIFSYLFTVVASLQGLFIFIFHCYRHVKIRQLIIRLISDHKKNLKESQSSAMATSDKWPRLRRGISNVTSQDTQMSQSDFTSSSSTHQYTKSWQHTWEPNNVNKTDPVEG